MSTFQPSSYSCAFQVAEQNPKTDTSSCDHFKEDQKNYRKLMSTAGLFTKTRRAFELKANASKKEYLSCKKLIKAKPKDKTEKKIAAKKKELGMSDKKSPSLEDVRKAHGVSTGIDTGTGTDTAQESVDAAAAAEAEAAESGGGAMPILLLVGGVVILGGIGYAIHKSGGKNKDSHKKQKIKHVVNIHMPGSVSAAHATEPPVVK